MDQQLDLLYEAAHREALAYLKKCEEMMILTGPKRKKTETEEDDQERNVKQKVDDNKSTTVTDTPANTKVSVADDIAKRLDAIEALVAEEHTRYLNDVKSMKKKKKKKHQSDTATPPSAYYLKSTPKFVRPIFDAKSATTIKPIVPCTKPTAENPIWSCLIASWYEHGGLLVHIEGNSPLALAAKQQQPTEDRRWGHEPTRVFYLSYDIRSSATFEPVVKINGFYSRLQGDLEFNKLFQLHASAQEKLWFSGLGQSAMCMALSSLLDSKQIEPRSIIILEASGDRKGKEKSMSGLVKYYLSLGFFYPTSPAKLYAYAGSTETAGGILKENRNAKDWQTFLSRGGYYVPLWTTVEYFLSVCKARKRHALFLESDLKQKKEDDDDKAVTQSSNGPTAANGVLPTGPKRDRSGNPIGAAAGAGAGGGGGAGYGAASGAVPMPMYKDDYDVSDSDTKTQILEGFSGASTVMLPGFSNASTVVLEDPILESAPAELLDATKKEQRFRAAYEAYQKDFAERSAVKEAEDKQKEEEKQRMMLSSKEKEEYQKQQQLYLEKQADADIMTSMGLPLKKSRIDRHHKPATTQEKDVSSYITELLGGSKDLAAVALSRVTPMYKWTRREARDHKMQWSSGPELGDIQFTSSHYFYMDSTQDTMFIHYGTIESALKTDEEGEHSVTMIYPESFLWDRDYSTKLLGMNHEGDEIFIVGNEKQMEFADNNEYNEPVDVIGNLYRIRLDGDNSRIKQLHRIDMKKQMDYGSGRAAVHSSGKAFALLYTPTIDDPNGGKELVISLYNEEKQTWDDVVHQLPWTQFQMIFSESSGDLILKGSSYLSGVDIVTFTKSSQYHDKKEVSGEIKTENDHPLFFKCEHKGVLYFSDEANDDKDPSTTYSMETATGKIIPAFTLENTVCRERIVMINDSLMAVVYQRCNDDENDNEPAIYYRTYRPEALHLYGSGVNKK